MALIFHDGFETGGAENWASVTGSPTFIAGAANTGNYGMRCNVSGASAYVTKVKVNRRITFYLYINSGGTPDIDCIIYGAKGTAAIVLNTSRQLELWVDGPKKDTGTALNEGQWYRVSMSLASAGCKIYVDGSEDCTTATAQSLIGDDIGVITSCTADLYFDDYATDNTDSTDDLGDIRTLAARPIGEGTDQDTATSKADGWVDNTESAVAVFGELDSDPPVTTSYNLFDGGGTARYSVTMDECGSGNLSGIGGSDTIEAVNFMWYYKTEGGGADDYGSKIIVSDGTLTNDNIDDPKDPTWLAGYHADTPSGANAWTQAYVNSIEMGMAGITPGSKGIWAYEFYAMVAFKVPASGNVTVNPTVLSLTATLAAPTVVGDVTFDATALALSASIIAPNVLVEASVSPSTLAANLTLNAPTISIVQNASVSPSVLSLTAALNSPTVVGDVTVAPSAQGLAATLIAPSIVCDVTISPSVLGLAATLNAPTVDIIQSITVEPAALSLTGTLIDPVVSIVQNALVMTSALNLTATLNAPSVVGDVLIDPSVLSGTLTLNAPAIVMDVVISASALALTATLNDPIVDISGNVTIYHAAAALTVAVQYPVIVIVQSVTIEPTAIGLAAIVNSPAIKGDVVISPSAISLVSVLHSPTINVSGSVTVEPSAMNLVSALHSPTINISGSVTVEPSAMNLTTAVIAPIVTVDATFTAAELALTGTVHTPSLNISAVISPSAFGLKGQVIDPVVLAAEFLYGILTIRATLSILNIHNNQSIISVHENQSILSMSV